MQKQTILLQGLISTSLFTFICNTQAQESVSSFEQSLINQTEQGKQVQPANYDMEALADELKTRGWDLQHKADGSLILIPQKSSNNSSSKEAEKKLSTDDQWQQLKHKLQNAGWSAVLDAEGAMLLTPPKKVSTSKSEVIPHIKDKSDNSNVKYALKDMQKKLKESGWNVINNSDGSISLYPPKPTSLKQTASNKLHLCTGTKPPINIALPVDSWQKAHDIAQEWLKNESIPHSTVGKIREIFNIYIISIVSNEAPFVLRHQIAIRKNNGTVIVLN